MPKVTNVYLNKDEFMKWLKSQDKSRGEISRMIGKGDNYINHLLVTDLKMPEHVYAFFLRVFDLPNGSFLDKPTLPQSTEEWSVNLTVKDKKVHLQIKHGNGEVASAYAKVFGDTEHDVVQSISYAAHMCYKLSEQTTY